MRVAILNTSTNNTSIFLKSLSSLGHDVRYILYDVRPDHSWLLPEIERISPDVVIYVGAIEGHHGNVPKAEALATIGRKFTLVLLCCDGAEPAWWPLLEKYYRDCNFSLFVNIDGVRTSPIGWRGLTTLCPIDVATFSNPPPWKSRPNPIGFSGGMHPPARAAVLQDLASKKILSLRIRDGNPDSYNEYRDFLFTCKSVLNFSITGSGIGKHHVKARVIEAALAGCLVIEPTGSPLEMWFKPNVDYVTYNDVEDIAKIFANINSITHEKIAESLRNKILEKHSPPLFWGRIFGLLGLMPYTPSYQPPYVDWSMIETEKKSIDNIAAVHSVPALISSHNSINLVSYNGLIYAVPQRLSTFHVDLQKDDSVKIFEDVISARKAIKEGKVS